VLDILNTRDLLRLPLLSGRTSNQVTLDNIQTYNNYIKTTLLFHLDRATIPDTIV